MSDKPTFKVLTPETLAATAADRWKSQYFTPRVLGGPKRWFCDDKKAIWERLSSLHAPSPGAVDRVIGNSTWTDTMCEQCRAERVPVVVLDVAGGEYVSEICERCAESMVGAFRGFVIRRKYEEKIDA